MAPDMIMLLRREMRSFIVILFVCWAYDSMVWRGSQGFLGRDPSLRGEAGAVPAPTKQSPAVTEGMTMVF
jgi:hypothetical protein